MSRVRALAGCWLPVVLWMALIFAGSGDLLSDHRTGRFLGPLLRWFKPDISQEQLHRLQVLIRKTGHVTEYAFLGFLATRAFARARGLFPVPWSPRAAWLALLLCLLYATSDEIHQSLVPTRYGSPVDVLIDTLGAAAGLAAAWLGARRAAARTGAAGLDKSGRRRHSEAPV